MRVEAFDEPLRFREAAEPLARSNAPLFAFLHAWTGGVAAHRPDRCYMAVASDREPEGFALQRDEGPVLLGACSEPAAIAFADAYASIDRDAAGVTGTERACDAFAARWREITGRTQRLRHRMRNHVLRTLIAPPRAPGAMRGATEADREWLCAQLRAFANEANIAITDARVARYVDERLAEGSYRIWESAAGSQAFAGFTAAGAEASRIGPVYTLADSRRRGVGSALVAALCDELLAHRPQVFLVTDLANATSNALYRRLGFEPLDDTVVLDFVAGT